MMQTIKTINTNTVRKGTATVFESFEDAEILAGVCTVGECESGYYIISESDGGFNIDVNSYVGRRIIACEEQ